MKTNDSFISLTSKGIFIIIAIMLNTNSFAKDSGTIGLNSSSNSFPMQVRKVETNAFSPQKKLMMKTILYVHDKKNAGEIDSQIVGTETRIYSPVTGQVTHISVVGVAAYPIEANSAYVIVAPGAKNVKFKGNNNYITVGGNRIPPPPQ
jgi:hypothetical protein